MNKKEAKKLAKILKEHLDEELFLIYYRVDDFKFPERLWNWEIVLEYQGKLLLGTDLITIWNLFKHHKSFKIVLETKEIILW